MDKIYFKGLNGIRAIAALIVMIFHIDLFMPLFKMHSIGYSYGGMAVYGVILFFVLSGYLITFLLLTEKDKFQNINIKFFYFRRILRIWPLYYLVIIISVFLILIGITDVYIFDNKIGLTLFLYSLLLSNVGYVLGCGVLSMAALWSVGVEEQFYLFWPWLVRKSKNLLRTLIILIIIYNIIKFIFKFYENGIIYSIVTHTSIDCMAIGGIASYLYFKNKTKILSIFYNPIVQIFSWSFFIISTAWKPIYVWSMINYEMHAFVYAIIILNVSTNPKSIINLENNFLNFFGKISYGIYVYHLMIISILSFLYSRLFHDNNNVLITSILLYLLIISLTIGISILSYKYYEDTFLRKKIKFSKVQSNEK